MGFSNVLKAELYKLTKAKSLIKVLIAIVIIFVIASLLYSFMYNIDEVKEILNQYNEASQKVVKIDEETVKEAEKAYEEHVQNMEGEKANQKLLDSKPYELKATVTLYKYLYENDIDVNSVNLFGSTGALTTNGYMQFILNWMVIVMVIYSMVCIIRSVAGERNNGALKMQLLRPVSKDAMLFAKLLAVLIVSIALFIFICILTAIVGIIAYSFDAKPVLVVFNATSVHQIGAASELIIDVIYYCGSIIAYTVLALFCATMIKKAEGLSLALVIVVYLIGASIENLLGYIYIGYAGFNINMSWISTLSVSGPSMNYMNFYSMVGIMCAYVALMLTASVITFRRTEIHN